MAPTSSTSSTYHTPLDIGTQTAQAIEDRLTSLDAALVVRQTNITTEASRAEGAEAALLEGYTAADTTETLARAASDAAEATIRAQADAAEALARQSGDASLQAQLAALVAVASTSGGTASTTLTRQASAASISSIGGNGTTTTVVTTAAHGYTSGDVVQVAGTTNYNGTSAAITVLSTTSFSYPSAVNAATETTGTVATKLLTVASSASFVVGQRISVTNDQGQLHTTTVSAVAAGTITLAAAVPVTWSGAAKASVGAWVSTTLEEVALARTAIPSGTGYGMAGLADTMRITNGNLIHPKAYGAVANDPTVDNTAALNAALAVANSVVLLDANTTYYIAGSIRPTTGSRLCGMGRSSIIKKPSADYEAIIIDNVTDVEIASLTVDGTATITGGGAESRHIGVELQNCQRIMVRNVVAKNFTIGIFARMHDIETINGTLSPIPAIFGVHNSEISGCTSTDNKDHGIAIFRDCRSIRVIGNTCLRNGTGGITLDDGTVGDEAKVSVSHPTGFAASPQLCTVVGNVCNDNTTMGIFLSGAQHCTVAGNVCQSNGVYKDLANFPDGSKGYFGVTRNGYGIELANLQNHRLCRYNTITGNVCSGNRRVGITLFGVQHNTVVGNACTDNGDDWAGTPAAAGVWLLEAGSYQQAAVTAGYQSTLTATAAAGATVLQVASTATGAAAGQGLYLVLTDGTQHPTRIVSVDSATQLTVATAVPAGKSAAIGAVIGQPALYGSTLTAGVVAGNTSMPVATSAGATIGMTVQLTLDNGAVHSTTISGIADATHITLTAAIPASRSAATGTPIGQVVLSYATDPTLTGQSGPEFAAGVRFGATVIKNRPQNPNENDTEYATVSAVNSGARTVTLTAPIGHAIATGGATWQPMPASFNHVANNVLTRTQAGRQPAGVRINDPLCQGNTIRNNPIVDLTGNSESNWAPIADNNSGAIPTQTSQNIFDRVAHRGTATLNAGSPPSVTVTTDALQPGSAVTLTRKTAASTPANTGVPFIYSRTDAAYAVARATILDAAASTGATSIVVLNAADVVAGRTIAITLTSGSVHTTTVGAGYVSGTTVPLTVALPSAAALNNSVVLTVPAVAGSFVIRGTVNGDDGQIGWSISN